MDKHERHIAINEQLILIREACVAIRSLDPEVAKVWTDGTVVCLEYKEKLASEPQ